MPSSQFGSSPTNPGVPSGSVPAGAASPVTSKNLYGAPKQSWKVLGSLFLTIKLTVLVRSVAVTSNPYQSGLCGV